MNAPVPTPSLFWGQPLPSPSPRLHPLSQLLPLSLSPVLPQSQSRALLTYTLTPPPELLSYKSQGLVCFGSHSASHSTDLWSQEGPRLGGWGAGPRDKITRY